MLVDAHAWRTCLGNLRLEKKVKVMYSKLTSENKKELSKNIISLTRLTNLLKERHEAAISEVRELIQESNSNYTLNSAKLKGNIVDYF